MYNVHCTAINSHIGGLTALNIAADAVIAYRLALIRVCVSSLFRN